MFGRLQGATDAPGPFVLARVGGDQVLAYLDLDMRQAARLPMTRDGVVGFVADEVGFVIADHETGLAAQAVEHQPRETAVAVIEYRGVHLAPYAFENVRHAVLGDEDGGLPRRGPLVEQRAYLPMIGLEDLGAPRRDGLGGEADIAGDLDVFADGRNRARHGRIAIAVDHQPRIILRDQRRMERLGHTPRHAQRPDVPGNVSV